MKLRAGLRILLLFLSFIRLAADEGPLQRSSPVLVHADECLSIGLTDHAQVRLTPPNQELQDSCWFPMSYRIVLFLLLPKETDVKASRKCKIHDNEAARTGAYSLFLFERREGSSQQGIRGVPSIARGRAERRDR